MKIVTVTCSRRPEMWSNLFENITRQTRRPDHSFLLYHKTEEHPLLIAQMLNERDIPFSYWQGNDSWNLSRMFLGLFGRIQPVVDRNTLACVMDDDDWYGPGYLQQVEDAFKRHPDAAMLGKSDYWARWIGKDKKKRYQMDASLDDPVANVAGGTIVINMAKWLDWDEFRHDPDNYWADTSVIVACKKCGGRIYNTGPEEWFLQRYGEEHQHGWNMPEPEEGD